MKIASRYTLGLLIGCLGLQTAVQANPWIRLAATIKRAGIVAAVTSPSWVPFSIGYHSGKKKALVGKEDKAIFEGELCTDFCVGLSWVCILNPCYSPEVLAISVPMGSYGIGKMIGARHNKI
jgi:hypothetical protein